MASAGGWLATCAAYLRMDISPRQRLIALTGVLVGSSLILMKLLPFVPGHFTAQEFAALGAWAALGVALNLREKLKADHSP